MRRGAFGRVVCRLLPRWGTFTLFNCLALPVMVVFVLLDVLVAGAVVLLTVLFVPLFTMRRYFRQFALLMRKNAIIMWRRPVYTIIELGLPLLLLPIVLFALKNIPDSSAPAVGFEKFPVYGGKGDLDTALPGGIFRKRACGLDSISMLYYSTNNLADELMNNFSARYIEREGKRSFIPVQKIQSTSEMLEMLRNDSQPRLEGQEVNLCLKYFGGIVFDEVDVSRSPKLSYHIHMSSLAKVWRLDRNWDRNMYLPPRDQVQFPPDPAYWSSGIVSVQRAIGAVFVSMVPSANVSINEDTLNLWRAPTPSYLGKAYMTVMSYFPLLAAIFLLFVVIHTASEALAEKESGMKAYLAVMGLTPSMFHFSHWTSSVSLLAMCVLCYAAAVVSFALLMASVIRTSSALMKWVLIIWFALILASMSFIGPPRSEVGASLLRAINPTNAFVYAMDAFSDSEIRGLDIGWLNMFHGSSSTVTVGLALTMLIVDIVWMSLLTVYLDNVFPIGDSARKSPLFFIKWIWSRNKAVEDDYGNGGHDCVDSANIESEQAFSHDEADICVERLTKVWDGTGERAVDSLSFKAYRGQVTVLLGHNGAGKSTTFSVISGITAPSTGSVRICHQEIASNLDDCRQNIGYCPQTNPLFDYLTVKEHLTFFQRLKRGSDLAADDNVEDILRQVELMEKKFELARNLSGGMKRKLCVGMSLVGGSRVVLLDEPTAGMDPGARQTISELLERNKKDRTILLTTHYMDEADRLGDRIAIMVKGRLECCGSPDFLKRRFGAGYILSVDVSDNATNGQLGAKNAEAQMQGKIEKILKAVKSHIPFASLEQQQGDQIEILLPLGRNVDGAHPRFVTLFEDLENNSANLSIRSFGLSLNSLEQVFLKVNELVEPSEGRAGEVAERQASLIFGNQYELRLHGPRLWFAQIRALVSKRVYYILRHPFQFLFQVLMPFFVILGFIKMLQYVSKASDQTVTYNLESLGDISMPLQSGNSKISRKLQYMSKQYPEVMRRDLQDQSDLNHTILPWMIVHPPVGIGFAAQEGSDTIGIFNGQAFHAPILVQNFYANALLGVKEAIKFSLSVYQFGDVINPMEYRDMFVAFIVIFAFSMLTSAFTMFVVEDRRTKFKHQQLLTRLHIVLYWLVMIVFDFVIYAFLCALTLIVFFVFNMYEGHLGAIVLLWILYFFSCIPFIYCASFLFESTERAYVMVSCWNTIASGIAFVFYGLTRAFLGTTAAAIFQAVFMIFIPAFGLGWGVSVIGMMSTLGNVGSKLTDVDMSQLNIFTWDQLGSIVTYMLISAAVFWTLLFVLQSRTVGRALFLLFERIHRLRRKGEDSEELVPEDEDVVEESTRMLRTSDDDLSLSVRSLNKYYGKLHAVKSLTFGVKKDECFGLLGVNGAGKTSTFDILTGVAQSSSGDVTINGVNVNEQLAIGYCPQFDALLGDLTARQTLQILARLHGFEAVDLRVDNILECVELADKADKMVRSLSGGQKRRLSIGVALMSQTPLMLLDEPTAGVDPRARRHIWNLLTAARAHNCAMLLTSHSMVECETLCGRVGFMHLGKLMRIGTPQHLKTRFGSGYQLSITVEKSSALIRDKLNAIVVHEMGAQPTDTDADMPTYFWEIPKREGDRWSALFKKLNSIIERFPPQFGLGGNKQDADADQPAIRDSSLTQNSLEQVFLRFAQPEDEQHGVSACEGTRKSPKCPAMVNTRLRSTSSTEPIMGGGPTTSV
ncbi:hypothetical protein QR680_014152 [Steinernema hermaphroditum]|uniref:ABC transporter domain-containing protein n=1 Tax=Steinernema hermaphroditum TaxID=289476 RepID=A0AA39M3Q1_9BILA|nr:hypothetical protein QR680_014152 [Steinernema hermaphroditum]